MLEFEQARMLYTRFKTEEKAFKRLQKLHDYFVGDHDIKNKKARKGNKTYRIVHNFAKYITTISTGYFLGTPVSYVYSKGHFEKALDILEDNDEETVNYDNAVNCSIYGIAYELQYFDEQGEYNFVDLDPRNVIVIDDGRVKPTITDAIVFSETLLKENEYKVTMDVYDKEARYTYEFIHKVSEKSDTDIPYELVDLDYHGFDKVPIIKFRNNKFEMGDWEDCIELMDAYNNAVSGNVEDLADFTDAFLKLINMPDTERKDIQQAKEDKVLMLDEDGDADWLIKNVNDTFAQNIKNELKNDIHKFSFVPDMSDESFGSNLSGVAILYKLLALEQVRGQKARMFKKALTDRLDFINKYVGLTQHDFFDHCDVKLQFKPNLPPNLLEEADLVQKLQGILPQEVLLSLLSFIQDVKQVIEMKDKEDEKKFGGYENFKDEDSSEVVDQDDDN
ncbi:phage portal protein [Bacillus paranthracis]|uniref:portal protein n=1 Tax=Bacillus phage phi4B1 TaxID=1643324 RepID=UPI000200F423|nr:phage portal protein [Bacillus paranthracis]YP_009206303.1 portal protein [Bacillus phage phi4B1]ADY20355.1 SPP1 family phage portal protein [Bacillus thuringiensis serovar finitimus YBT-020]MRC72845.1 phage portal protein [Bacillus thuringiensis]OTX71297.1 phage portal protein [Bacillus thuringiensis serovar finitimus]ALF02548.1 SPP1 family portal protein [Bacillus phage phi4B1]MCR6799368.1 phage portal protein [Bacillus paranthracis]